MKKINCELNEDNIRRAEKILKEYEERFMGEIEDVSLSEDNSGIRISIKDSTLKPELVWLNERGTPNQAAQDLAFAFTIKKKMETSRAEAKRKFEENKKKEAAKYGKDLDKTVKMDKTEEPVKSNKTDAPLKMDKEGNLKNEKGETKGKVNKKKFAKRLGAFVLAGTALVTAILGGKHIGKNIAGDKSVDTATNNENVAADAKDSQENANSALANEIAQENQYVSYEEFMNKCADANNYLNNELKLNLPNNSIASMMYMCNYKYMSKDDVNMMVEDGIIPDTAENIVQTAYRVKNVEVNQNWLGTTKNRKEIDLSCFAIKEEDKVFATRLYNDVDMGKKVIAGQYGSNEDLVNIFDNYYKYLTNDESTNYSNTIQNGTPCQQFMAGLYLSPMCDIGRAGGVDESKVTSIQNDIKGLGENPSIYKIVSGYDFSTVFAGVRQGCNPEASKTR